MCQCNENFASASGSNCEKVDTRCPSGSGYCFNCDDDLCVRCVRGYSVVPPNGNCILSTSCSNPTFIISDTGRIDGKFWGSVCEDQSSSGGGGLTTTVIVIIAVVAVVVIIFIGVISVVIYKAVKAR
jgi:hypothetical protein